MPKYYTHGSIENVSYDFVNCCIKLHIKPLSEFEVVVDKKKYLVFVDNSKNNPSSFLVSIKEGFVISKTRNDVESCANQLGEVNGRFNGAVKGHFEGHVKVEAGYLHNNFIANFASILPYWLSNKTKLKFIVKSKNDKQTAEIIKIEPIK